MIDNLSIAVYEYNIARNMLSSISVDEILLPTYMDVSTNFRGLSLRVEMASRLKHMNSVLFALKWRPNASPLLLLALGLAAEIQLGQLYLPEALGHLHHLRL